jgi:hypothetical protein
LKSRLGRSGTGIQPFQRFAPPGKADRAQHRLGRCCHHFRKRIVDCEQGFEGGAELGRPMQPYEVPVRQLSDN